MNTIELLLRQLLFAASFLFATSLSAQIVRPFHIKDTTLKVARWMRLLQDPTTKKVYRCYSTGKKRFYSWEKWNEEHFSDGLLDEEGNWYAFKGIRKALYGVDDGFAYGINDVSAKWYERKLVFKKNALVCIDSFYNPPGDDRIFRFSWANVKFNIWSLMTGQTGDTLVSVIADNHLDKSLKHWQISKSGHFRLKKRHITADLISYSNPFQITCFPSDTVISSMVYSHEQLNFCVFKSHQVFPATFAIATIDNKGACLWQQTCPNFAGTAYTEGAPYLPLFQDEQGLVVFAFQEMGVPQTYQYENDKFKSRSGLNEAPLSVRAYHQNTGKISWEADIYAAIPEEEIRRTEILDIFKINEQCFGVVLGFVERNVAKGYRWAKYTNTSVHVFDFDGKFVEKKEFPVGEKDFFKVKSLGDGFEVHTMTDIWTYSIR